MSLYGGAATLGNTVSAAGPMTLTGVISCFDHNVFTCLVWRRLLSFRRVASTPDCDTSEKYRYAAPICIACFCKSMPFDSMDSVYTSPMCMACTSHVCHDVFFAAVSGLGVVGTLPNALFPNQSVKMRLDSRKQIVIDLLTSLGATIGDKTFTDRCFGPRRTFRELLCAGLMPQQHQRKLCSLLKRSWQAAQRQRFWQRPVPSQGI